MRSEGRETAPLGIYMGRTGVGGSSRAGGGNVDEMTFRLFVLRTSQCQIGKLYHKPRSQKPASISKEERQ